MKSSLSIFARAVFLKGLFSKYKMSMSVVKNIVMTSRPHPKTSLKIELLGQASLSTEPIFPSQLMDK